MKIVHINTYAGNGGAGRACLRLNKALVDQGIDSTVWINFSLVAENTVHNFSTSFFQKWLAAIGIVLDGLVAKYLTKPLRIPFSFPLWGKNISNHPALLQADIIHIHWINHGFLRPRDLIKLAKLNKPIVWTLHDSNTFTGGCHVRYDCQHYQQECGNCPILKKSHPQDWSRKIWQAKQKAYAHIGFVVIAPSKWMAASIKKSKLLALREVHIIPNTLNTHIFKPTLKYEARKILGIDPDKFILMSGFMPSRKDLHKGTPYLIEAIELFAQRAVDSTPMELLIFGNRDTKNNDLFKLKTTFLGTLSDDTWLALYYSAADVFVVPSLEDNLPNTVMESLACGTPVVAFSTGGIPDMVSHKQNGYLATYKSASDLAEGITWVYQHSNPEIIHQKARQTIERHFTEQVIANKHIALYQQLLQ